ncbi:MAG TPA: DUF922 domain-containing protein [Roseiflexaceae bacterium]|nr:DUF922 domain-containing protein [Roseiflexaceae bacterium]
MPTHRSRRPLKRCAARRRAEESGEREALVRAAHPLVELQARVGNAAVERALAQRYPVRVRPGASCAQVVDWLNTSNPHAPDWALTRAGFTWSGGFTITGSAPSFTLSLSNPQVRMSGPRVDMPEWRPGSPAMREAWQDMYARLRRHEAEHEAIARRWHATLTERLQNLSLEVNASSRAQVRRRARALVNAAWDSWLAEYRADMTSIDPHTEELHCPTAQADAPAGEEGGDGAPA